MLDVCLKNNVEYLGINFVPSSRRCVGAEFYQYLIKNFSNSLPLSREELPTPEGIESEKTPPRPLNEGELKGNLVALFMNQSLDEIEDKLSSGIFNIVQLHGNETPKFCTQIKEKFPNIKIWKALKIQKNVETKHLSSEKNLPNPLEERELKGEIKNFAPHIDAFLFDGPKPGSGQTADFSALKKITDFCDSLNNKFELNDQIQDSSSNLNAQPQKISYGIAGGINLDNIGLFRETFGGADFFDTASGVEVGGYFCEEKLNKILSLFILFKV
jgi:phosphoribosylanthranilate isomerase